MASISSLISAIERRWTEVATDSILNAAREKNLTDIYVASFWLFYVDYSAFYPPYLCINTEDLSRKDRERGHHYRWAPSEWELGLHDATDTMAENYEPLMELLKDASEEQWDEAIEAHYEAMARVCRHLTAELRTSPGTRFSDSFVAGIFEERESEDVFERLVHLSIDPEILSQLPEPTWSTGPSSDQEIKGVQNDE